MDRRDDARTTELNNLRLALAAFALQLATFEMRLHLTAIRKSGRPLGAGAKPGLPAPPPDINYRAQKERLIGGQ
jgi:hypothetical protein